MNDWWGQIRPYVRVERYGNRKQGQSRIEVTDRYTNDKELQRLTGECPVCGRPFTPVRRRDGYYAGAYVRVTCGGVVCTRSERARLAYAALLEYLDTGEQPDKWQARLL
jgi:hypothetical protein